MKKPVSNIATAMTQKLIHLLQQLEDAEYKKMSNAGKKQFDKIWKLLGQPTNAELKKIKNKNGINK
tara:strand:- start:242 stop:439 length:198 start_codon:yes stop_codon:yes gene_type:complete